MMASDADRNVFYKTEIGVESCEKFSPNGLNEISYQLKKTSNSTAYIGFNTNEHSGFYKTNDNGNSWVQISDSEVSQFFVSESEGFFIQTQQNLFYWNEEMDAEWFAIHPPIGRLFPWNQTGFPEQVLFTGTNWLMSTNGLSLISLSSDAIKSSSEPNYYNEIPKSPTLKVYPNPFNPSTTIELILDRSSSIQVDIYNSVGMLVKQMESVTNEKGIVSLTVDVKGWSS